MVYNWFNRIKLALVVVVPVTKRPGKDFDWIGSWFEEFFFSLKHLRPLNVWTACCAFFLFPNSVFVCENDLKLVSQNVSIGPFQFHTIANCHFEWNKLFFFQFLQKNFCCSRIDLPFNFRRKFWRNVEYRRERRPKMRCTTRKKGHETLLCTWISWYFSYIVKMIEWNREITFNTPGYLDCFDYF